MNRLKRYIKSNKALYFPIRMYHKTNGKVQNLIFEIRRGFRRIGWCNRRYKVIRGYKDIHKGERCFIIATGPSLRIEDIEKLKNEYTFGLNAICMLFEKTQWRPTYFGVQDRDVFMRAKDRLIAAGCKNVWIGDYLLKEFDVPKEWIIYPENTAYHSYDCYFKEKYYAKFSPDAYQAVYDGYTVTYSLLQIAVYMGFQEIYLLGCDCNYDQDEKKRHFMTLGNTDPTYQSAGKRMTVAYREAEKYCSTHGIKIYNATRGGMLEVFERADFDSLSFSSDS